MQPLIHNLESIVEEKMSILEDTAHSWTHVFRVLKVASFLAEKEEADLELVQVGALLHDIGRAVGEPHNETGAKLANKILMHLGYPQQRSGKIVKMVLHHPVSFRNRLETLEEKIVWDADKIDLLGAIGIARLFHWLGARPFENAVKTCLEELKPVYDLLNTPTAKEIAKDRYNRTIAFLSALADELSVNDLRMSRGTVRLPST